MPRTPLFWRLAAREACRRPLRSLLTLAGVVLGVAAVAAAGLAESATREHYVGLFRPLAGRATLEIVDPGGGTFAAVRPDVYGVREAVPVVIEPSALVTQAGPASLVVLGRDGGLLDLREGSDAGLVLAAPFAIRHGLAVGRPAKLMTARGPVELVVTGLLAKGGPAAFNGGAVGVLPLTEAQSVFGTPGQVSAVQLVLDTLDSQADPKAVAREVQAMYPGLLVRPTAERGRLGSAFLQPVEHMTGSLSAIALVAGAMVILNTILMHLAERRRQLALLRAVGATRRQVVSLVMLQAAALGVAGSLLGLPLGVALASLLLSVEQSFLGVPMPRLPLAAGPLLFAAAVGPLATLLAALPAARLAASSPPLAAITSRGVGPADPPSKWPPILGGVLVVAVGLFLVAVMSGRLPTTFSLPMLPFVAGSGLMACACLLPLAVPSLLRLAGLVLPAVFGVEGRLAVRQLSRQRGRTGLTVGVLFAAITACVAFGLSFLVNLRDIDRWFRGTIDVDFLVRAVAPDAGFVIPQAPLPASAFDDVRKLPACDHVGRLAFRTTRMNGREVILMAREFAPGRPLPLVLDAGDSAEVARALARGEVVLGSVLARRLGVGVGDTVEVPARGGPRELRVAGIAKEYTAGGMVFYMDWAAARPSRIDHANALVVTARPGEEEEFGADLADYCAKSGFLLQRNSDFAALIDHVAAGAWWFAVCMVGLIFLVAAAGVVNTLATNVLDQTRELGVLRALGMKRGQLRKLVVAQAAALALMSALPGATVGVLLAYLMNRSTPGLLGHDIPFHVEYGYVAACVAGLMALAMLAALVPARRAARLAVLDALRYE